MRRHRLGLHDEDTEEVGKMTTPAKLPALQMVGGDGIEPTAFSVSRRRSPTELTARDQGPSIAKGPDAVKRFFMAAVRSFRSRCLTVQAAHAIVSKLFVLTADERGKERRRLMNLMTMQCTNWTPGVRGAFGSPILPAVFVRGVPSDLGST